MGGGGHATARCPGTYMGEGTWGNPHQCPRAPVDLQSVSGPKGPSHEEEGPDLLRQCSSDLSHQPAGRDKIPIHLIGDMGPLPVVQIEQSVPEGGSPPRFGERHRGHPVENSTGTWGVVVTRPGGRTDLPGTRIPGDRIQLEPQARLLRVQVPQPWGLGNRRSLPRLEPSKRYAFPPFALVGSAIQRASAPHCRVILIAPFWPSQLWFRPLPTLVAAAPRILPAFSSLLTLQSGKQHDQPEIIRLVAWRLSGVPSERRAFRRRLPRWWPMGEEIPPFACMIRDSDCTENGAKINRFLQARGSGRLPNPRFQRGEAGQYCERV